MWPVSRRLRDETSQLLCALGSSVDEVCASLDPMYQGRALEGPPEQCLERYLDVILGTDRRVRHVVVDGECVTVLCRWRRKATVYAPPALRSFLNGATRGVS